MTYERSLSRVQHAQSVRVPRLFQLPKTLHCEVFGQSVCLRVSPQDKNSERRWYSLHNGLDQPSTNIPSCLQECQTEGVISLSVLLGGFGQCVSRTLTKTKGETQPTCFVTAGVHTHTRARTRAVCTLIYTHTHRHTDTHTHFLTYTRVCASANTQTQYQCFFLDRRSAGLGSSLPC